MTMMEQMPIIQLANTLRNSLAVVALRGVAEVMLNGDQEKLNVLLANEELTEHWRQYELSPFVDMRDDDYARQLEEKLQQLNIPA